jgi:hypothetical protein
VSTHTLRVEWPVLDPAMRDNEAMADAAIDWPGFAEGYQVTVVEPPRIWVEPITAAGRLRHRAKDADRLVVCEASVFQRIARRAA